MNTRPLCATLLLLAGISAHAETDAFVIAKDGKPACSISVSDHASERTRAAAAEIGQMLGAITGGAFEIKAGAATEGIIMGLASEFPEVTKDERLSSKDIHARENYLIRSESKRLILLGNTEAGLEHATWDVLYRLGVRQYFPGKHWEIVPKMADVSIEASSIQTPSFNSRSIWFGYGAIPERKADYEAWCKRNRATKGIVLSSGHAYDKVLHDHAADFKAHPEWLALVKGERKGPKFCISNPELRKLVVEHAMKLLAADPTLDSISCEPSDGGGWCECAQCAKLGSISDQALLLTNEVARAVGTKLVGQYAYNEHSPAPSILAEPNVVVSIAAGFIKGGFTMDQLIDGWSSHAKTLGIREYLSVHPWDHDLPGQARGARLDYLQETIPHFQEKGARFYSAESSDNWGCNGLGYYVASRLLWDVSEAGNVEAIFDDFLDRSFGPAKLPMSKFYTLINRSRPPESDDLLGRMYRHLKDAGELEIDTGIRSRLDDLALYTRACELTMDYSAAKGEARQVAVEALLKHAYRTRALGMIHTLGLWRGITRDKSIKLPEDCEWKSPEGKNPWKLTTAYCREDIDALIDQGIANRKVADFEPATFSTDLVPATKLHLTSSKPGDFGMLQRGNGSYWTWIDKAPATIKLQVTAGLIYQNQGPAKLHLYPAGETQGLSVSDAEIAPDKQPHEVILKTTFTGLHRIEVDDHRTGTRLDFPAGLPATFNATTDQPATLNGRYNLYFYVPKGTTIVGGYASGPGRLMNGAGKQAHEFDGKPGYFKVPVEPGEDGKLWKFEFTSGERVLLTVPPQMARSAEELLLPREVVGQ